MITGGIIAAASLLQGQGAHRGVRGQGAEGGILSKNGHGKGEEAETKVNISRAPTPYRPWTNLQNLSHFISIIVPSKYLCSYFAEEKIGSETHCLGHTASWWWSQLSRPGQSVWPTPALPPGKRYVEEGKDSSWGNATDTLELPSPGLWPDYMGGWGFLFRANGSLSIKNSLWQFQWTAVHDGKHEHGCLVPIQFLPCSSSQICSTLFYDTLMSKP